MPRLRVPQEGLPEKDESPDFFKLGEAVEKGIALGAFTEDDLIRAKKGKYLTALRAHRGARRGEIIQQGIDKGAFTEQDLAQFLPKEYANLQTFRIKKDIAPTSIGQLVKITGAELGRAVGLGFLTDLPKARETSLPEVAVQEAARFGAFAIPFTAFQKAGGALLAPILRRAAPTLAKLGPKALPIAERALSDAIASAATVAHDLKSRGEDFSVKDLLIAGLVGGTLGGALGFSKARQQGQFREAELKRAQAEIENSLRETIEQMPDDELSEGALAFKRTIEEATQASAGTKTRFRGRKGTSTSGLNFLQRLQSVKEPPSEIPQQFRPGKGVTQEVSPVGKIPEEFLAPKAREPFTSKVEPEAKPLVRDEFGRVLPPPIPKEFTAPPKEGFVKRPPEEKGIVTPIQEPGEDLSKFTAQRKAQAPLAEPPRKEGQIPIPVRPVERQTVTGGPEPDPTKVLKEKLGKVPKTDQPKIKQALNTLVDAQVAKEESIAAGFKGRDTELATQQRAINRAQKTLREAGLSDQEIKEATGNILRQRQINQAQARERQIAKLDEAERRIADIDNEIASLEQQGIELAKKNPKLFAALEAENLELQRLDKSLSPQKRGAMTRQLTAKADISRKGSLGQEKESLRQIRESQAENLKTLGQITEKIETLRAKRQELIETAFKDLPETVRTVDEAEAILSADDIKTLENYEEALSLATEKPIADVKNQRAFIRKMRESGAEMDEGEILSKATKINTLTESTKRAIKEKKEIARDIISSGSPKNAKIQTIKRKIGKVIAEKTAEKRDPVSRWTETSKLETILKRKKQIENETRAIISESLKSIKKEAKGAKKELKDLPTIEDAVKASLSQNREYQRLLELESFKAKGTTPTDPITMGMGMFPIPPGTFGKNWEFIRGKSRHEVTVAMPDEPPTKMELTKDYLSDVSYELRHDIVSKLVKNIRLPFWNALRNPEFEPVYKNISTVDSATQRLAEVMGRASKPFDKLPETSQKKIGPALYTGTLQNRTWTPKELKEQFGLSNAEIRGYEAVRRTLDVLPKFIRRMAKQLGREDDPVITQIIDAMQKEGYFPLTRHGRFGVGVKNGKKTVFFTSDDSWSVINDLRNELVAKYGGVGDFKVLDIIDFKKNNEAFRENLALGPFLDILKKSKRFSDPTIEQIDQAIIDYFKTQLAGGHFAPREQVAGYSENVAKDLRTFIANVSRALPKRFMRPEIIEHIKNIKDPSTRAFANDLFKYYYGEGGPKEGPVLQQARRFVYDFFLAAKPAFGILNASQRLITTIPEAMKYRGVVGGAATTLRAQGLELALWNNLIHKNMNTARAINELPVSANIRHSLTTLLKEGLLSERYYEDIIGDKLSKVDKAVGIFGWASERSNRWHAGITAGLIGEGQGLKGEALTEFMRNFVNRTQFVFGKQNRPEIARGLKSAAFIFRGFVFNYYNWLHNNAMSGSAGRKAVVASLAMIGAMSGLLGLPGAKKILKLYEDHIAKKGPKERLNWELEKQKIRDNPVAGLFMDGISGALGLSGFPFAFPELVQENSDVLEVIFGAPAAVGRDIAEILRTAGGQLVDKIFGVDTEPINWVELAKRTSPGAVKNILKAFEKYPTDLQGRPILTLEDVKRMPKDIRPYVFELYKKGLEIERRTPKGQATLIQALGFTPMNKQRAYEIMRGVSQAEARRKELPSDINKGLARALFEKDKQKYIFYLKRARQFGIEPNEESIRRFKAELEEGVRRNR